MLVETARLYRFPDRLDTRNRLTVRDKLDLHGAGQRIADAGLQCVIGRETDGLRHDFLQLVPAGEARPAWTFVREGSVVRAWQGMSGADLGAFATLAEALSVALAARRAPPVRRRTSGDH